MKMQLTLKRRYYITAGAYIKFINIFKKFLDEKRTELKGLINRYEVGLQKIIDTEQEVGGMKVELALLKPQLETASKETAE